MSNSKIAASELAGGEADRRPCSRQSPLGAGDVPPLPSKRWSHVVVKHEWTCSGYAELHFDLGSDSTRFMGEVPMLGAVGGVPRGLGVDYVQPRARHFGCHLVILCKANQT